MSAFTIELVDGDSAQKLAPALATVLIDCVDGGASVSFMAPLERPKAEAFWRRVAEGVAAGQVSLLVARDGAGEIVGTVHLAAAGPENQPHRADVSKLLVHRRGRRQGVAAALMREVERVAVVRGKTLLVLDTVTGEPAEQLYLKLGWNVCGTIPNYALFPDGRPCATTVFWKAPGTIGAATG